MSLHPQFQRTLLVVLVFLPALSQTCRAQSGEISGRITDENGRGFPYASVILLGTQRGARADASGAYSIRDVPVGYYTLTTRVIGYVSSKQDSVLVADGRTTVVNFSMAIRFDPPPIQAPVRGSAPPQTPPPPPADPVPGPFGEGPGSTGKFSLGVNLGLDYPEHQGMGGVWHVAAGVPVNRSLSIGLELGTAFHAAEKGRTVWVNAIPRTSSMHAVSTLGILFRRSFGSGPLRPHVTAGVDWYTEWDDLDATATQSACTAWWSGVGFQGGLGSTLRLGSHWDLLGEAVYHLETKSTSDANFLMLRSGIHFFWRKRAPDHLN